MTEQPIIDLDNHESTCPDAPNTAICEFCKNYFHKDELENHIIKNCKLAKPGVSGENDVDPRPYRDMLQKNAKKLQGKSNSKVVVEDDYVEPNDFRDPGGRKKRDNSNESPGGSGKKPSKSPSQENKFSVKRTSSDLPSSQGLGSNKDPKGSSGSNLRGGNPSNTKGSNVSEARGSNPSNAKGSEPSNNKGSNASQARGSNNSNPRASNASNLRGSNATNPKGSNAS